NWAEEIPRRIKWCDYLIVLLSANSVRSEMVLEEVRLAHERRRAEGAPHYLPVRVKYTGPLGYALGAYLNLHQGIRWTSKADSPRVLQAILDVAQGRAEPPLSTKPGQDAPLGSALSDDSKRPEPWVDLRGVVAPGGSIRPDDPFY